MARFIEDRSALKKKKKDEKKTQPSSSVSKTQAKDIAQNVVNKTADTAKKVTNATAKSVQTQRQNQSNAGSSSSSQKQSYVNNNNNRQTASAKASTRTSGGQYGRAGTNARESASKPFQENVKYAGRERAARAKAQREAKEKETEQLRNRVSSSRNPRMLDTGRNTHFETRAERDKRLEEQRRQKSGYNNMASKEAQKVGNRIIGNMPKRVGLTEGKIGASTAGSFLDLSDMLSGAEGPGNGKSRDDLVSTAQQRKAQREGVASARNDLFAKRDEFEAKKQRLTKGAKGFEKAYYGAEESLQGMLNDFVVGAAIGGAWEVPLALRVYGESRGKAQQLGATETEDRLNAAKDALIEVATEHLGGAFGAVGKLTGGKKAFTPLTELLERQLAKQLEGKAIRNAATGALRWGSDVLGENVEEWIGNPLQNAGENLIYKNRLQAQREADTDASLTGIGNDIRSRYMSDPASRDAFIAHLNSKTYRDEMLAEYKSAGMNDMQANEVTNRMLDFMTAAATGDTKRMKDIRESLDPILTGDIRNKVWDWNENLESLASTSLMTGVTGLPGAVTTTARGQAILDSANSHEKIMNALRKTIAFDKDNSGSAQAMLDDMEKGYTPSATQAYSIMANESKVINDGTKAQFASEQVKDKRVKQENLLAPPAVWTPEGRYEIVGEKTAERYMDSLNDTLEYIDIFNRGRREDGQFKEEDARRVATAAAKFNVGTFTVQEAYDLSQGDKADRHVFEQMTGTNLNQYNVYDKKGNLDVTATNIKMRDGLLALSADNYVQSARIEQENWNDTARGRMHDQFTQGLGVEGDKAMSYALEEVDPRDQRTFMATAFASNKVYEDALYSDDEWHGNTEAKYRRMFPSVNTAVLKSVYEAGRKDKAESETPYLNARVKRDEKMSAIASGSAKAVIKGKFFNETPYDPETDTGRDLKANEQIVFEELAGNFNANVTMVDAQDERLLHAVDADGRQSYGNANVNLRTGEIYISNAADVGKIVHEFTHLGAVLAPEQFLEMSNYVIGKAYKANPEATKALIQSYKNTYKGKGLNDAQIREEVVADLVTDFINDERFARDIAMEEPGFFQQLYNAICDILRALRNILATGRITDEAVRDSILDEIDAYEQTRQMWVRMMREAAKYNATIGMETLQEQIYEEGRNSISDDIIGSEDITRELKENFDEYGEDEENLRIAAEAVADLQRVRVEERFSLSERGRDLDGSTGAVGRIADRGSRTLSSSQYRTVAKGITSDLVNDVSALNDVGVDLTESGSAVRFSLYSWEDTDIDALKAKLRTAGFDGKRINKWIRDVNSIAALISRDKERLNYTADQFQDALKPNAEYYYTLDLSTLCQKRRLYQGTYNKIMRHLVNNVLMPEDTVRLRAMMDEMGYQVPCGICYEESRKKNEGKFAERWLNGYGKKWKGYKNQEHTDPYIPTLYEVTTTEGREKLREEHPEAYESYVNYQKTRGSANPKISYTHTDYRGDILRMTENDIAKVKHIGGLRIQSFSDFEIPHVIDMMQAVMDMSAMNLTAQAYTKVPAFAEIFGGTGIKINLSLIGRWNEETQQLEFDAKEGIDPEQAFKLRDKYSKNVGTILVGSDDTSILKAWADPRVDMVIPFHRSGWSKKEFDKLGLVGYKDYTKGQTERYMMGKKDMALSTASKALGLTKEEKLQPIYSADYWDNNLSGKENAERYLALCAEKHYRPVFYQFLHDNGDGTWSLQEDGSTDGYWKSLIDFKMYDNDGVFAPQEEVQPVFDMDAANRFLRDYEGGADTLPVADDVVTEFLKEYKQNHPKAEFKIEDDSDVKFSLAMDLDEPYMQAVNSGNMDEAQRLVDEAAKEAGYTESLYHGTGEYFNVFRLGREGIHLGNIEQAEQVARNRYHDRSRETRYKWGEIKDRISEMDTEARQSLINRLERTSAHAPIFDGDISDDESVKAYAEDALQKYYGTQTDINNKSVLMRTFDRNVGENVMRMYARLDNPFVINGDILDWTPWNIADTLLRKADGNTEYRDDFTERRIDISGSDLNLGKWTRTAVERIANGEVKGDEAWRLLDGVLEQAGGYHGIKYLNQFEGDKNSYSYIALNRSDVKLADPVTYAEDGSVIPLSERFDPTNNDIRYSLPTQDSEGNILTDGQMEYFKNSQARDEQGRLVPVYHTTNRGGFTIFDPSHSDDLRSLFFSDDWDVSQTYGDYANSRFYYFDINNVEDVRKYLDAYSPDRYFLTQEQFEQAGGWEADFVDFENVTNGEQSDIGDYLENPDGYIAIIGVPDYSPDNTSYADTWVMAKSPDELVRELHNHFGWQRDNYRMGTQKGYYPCYLNLENPMIIDAHGQYWNEIAAGDLPIEDGTYFVAQPNVSGGLTLLLNGSRAVDVAKDEDEIANVLNEFFDIGEYAQEGFDIAHELLMQQSHRPGDIRFDTEDLYPFFAIEMHDTRGWAEIAAEQGYDGVIFHNIIDIGDQSDFDGLDEESTVYIAFSSNQVKDINNENPTEDPDIRWSIPEDEANSKIDYNYATSDSYEMLEMYEEMLSDQDFLTEFVNATDEQVNMDYFMKMLEKYGKADKKARKTGKAVHIKLDNTEEAMDAFYSSLVPETHMVYDDVLLEEGRMRMAASKQDFWNNLNTKWNDRWVSGGEVLEIKSVKKDVRNLVMGIMDKAVTDKKYDEDLVNKTLVDMRFAYQLMKQGRSELASALLYHSALRMIENTKFIEDDTAFREYRELRDYLRNTRISFSERYWSDVHFNEYRKRNMGRIKLVKGENNIDKGIYSELERQWPQYFGEQAMADNDLTTKDIPSMMEQLDYVLNLRVDPVTYVYSSEDCANWAFDIANDLYDIMEKGDRIVSTADRYKEKYEAKARAMKVRQAEALLRIRKARDEGIAKEKARFKEYREEQKEKKLHSKYFDSIAENHKNLSERLLTNTKDKHIPEQYKKALARLLAAFDLQTTGSKKVEARRGVPGKKTIKMQALKTALNNIEAKSSLFHVNDSITDIIERLLGRDGNGEYKESLSVEGKALDELTSAELKDINDLLKALVHEFNNYETVRVGIKRQQAADIGSEQIKICLDHVDAHGQKRDWNNFLGSMDKILNLDEVTPAYMFRMIDRNNTGIGLMFKELRRSFNRYVQNQKQINEWMDEILGEYHNKGKLWNKYGSDKIADWRHAKSAMEIPLESGRTISLTPAQMMSIYCLSNRQQAVSHMKGAGIVIQPVTYNARIDTDLRRIAQNSLEPAQLTDTDIMNIKSNLTPEQIKVATDLQQLMATKMAKWGNEASMAVIGIKLFEDPDYFPIKSDKAALEKDFSADQFAEAIRSFGFTKAVQPKASNSIAVDDIFDVVAEHCNQMNLYNAYSEAMNDFMKVYNYHEVEPTETGYRDVSVEQAIANAFSKKATTYIGTFMKDLNGNVGRDRTTGVESVMNDLLASAKKASVFANGRVALQQPTAIMRAFAVIDPKYLKGVSVTNATMREMFEHSSIALWKSWGYYDINMGKSIEDLIMNEGKWSEDMMTDLYGKLDNRTWTAIWGMCKAEIEDKHKDVKVGSDEYWELVGERMDEVVDLTQVVDSPFHRSHAMRSKNTLVKMFTSFMAEPTLTFNMVRDGLIRAREESQLGNKGKAGKILGRTMTVFLLSGATTAAAAAIWDVVRGKNPDPDDDDEDKTKWQLWLDNFLENLKDNINILNNIYYVKDVLSIFQGWDQKNLGLQGFKHLADAKKQFFGGKSYSKLSWWENTLAGVGYLTGIPFKTIESDVKALWRMTGLDTPMPVAMIVDQLDSMTLSDMNSGESSTAGAKAKSSGTKKDSGAKKSDKVAPSTPAKFWTYENAPFHVEDGSLADNFLNHFGINLTSAEIAAIEKEAEEAEHQKQIDKIKDSLKDYTGSEYDKHLWDKGIMEGYGKAIEDGDFDKANEIEHLFIECGGSQAFIDDKKLYHYNKNYVKTIVYDPTSAQIEQQTQMKNFLLSHGVTEQELSERVYKSQTAKELKVAFRIGDEDAMVEELVPLVRAGLSEEDYNRLWENRNRLDIKKYKESGGKYADRLKSTGTYNWPITGTITSRFGHRSSPGGVGSTYHQGLDIAGSMGDPVNASDGGTVIYTGWYGGAGKTVKIQHDDGTITQYSHLSWWDCKPGDIVAQGQYIGKVGSTGNSTGPHLHFGVIKDGNYVDPSQYLQG